MSARDTGLRVGLVEPHLRRYGGIRRMVEFGNRLVARGHSVTFFVPDGEVLGCSWMECVVPVRPMSVGFEAALDVVVFNHEPQWFLLERFSRARRRVFYALHDGGLYGKEGSWEAAWAGVDAQWANSAWTAERVAGVTGGSLPTVVLGGANREVFRPYGGEKRYTVLCTGVGKEWKGTPTVREAGRILGVPVEGYADKDLSQPALGREYDAATVFAVGSWFEGFCQPGLEALACGVPLVTTDNGGCREYAIDGVTALVVPPRDPVAMAGAIERLLSDEGLAEELSGNGLALIDERFDWEVATDRLVEVIDGVASGTAAAPRPPRPEPAARVDVSVVVLAWDNLLFTQRFAESVRRHTSGGERDLPDGDEGGDASGRGGPVGYELVVVDNGSARDAADYARQCGDRVVLNDTNLGFAVGMNQGLAVSSGEWVAFCNNDTILPPRWAERLLETARAYPNAGIVVPALTAARNAATVRSEPGDFVEVLAPFSAPPAAVVYLMRADVVRELGGWGEDYHIASGEDVDLAFKVWTNDLDIVYDSRVLVDHVGKGSASRLDNWEALWEANRNHFFTKWSGDTPIPRLASCPPERHARNRATAAAVVDWMQRYFHTRDRQKGSTPPTPKAATGPVPAATPAAVASEVAARWIAALSERADVQNPFLVRRADGVVFLIEGGERRPVPSGLVALALERQLGEIVEVAATTLGGWPEGVPVELFAVPKQAPFVIVGGQRLPVRGLPLPYAIQREEIEDMPEGAELNIAQAAARQKSANGANGRSAARTIGGSDRTTSAKGVAKGGEQGGNQGGRKKETAVRKDKPARRPDVDRLQAQLAEFERRNRRAKGWVEQLASTSGKGGDPFLVSDDGGTVFLVEGGTRRIVRSGLLAAALERPFGRARSASASELASWPEGVPVEVLEGPTGAPFIIVGGSRRPLRGIPMPNPVGQHAIQAFPKGPALNVAKANVSRARYEEATSGRFQLRRIKQALRRRGPVGLVVAGARKGLRRAMR